MSERESQLCLQDEATWDRMLHITADVLKHTTATLCHAGINALLQTTILPALALGYNTLPALLSPLTLSSLLLLLLRLLLLLLSSS